MLVMAFVYSHYTHYYVQMASTFTIASTAKAVLPSKATSSKTWTSWAETSVRLYWWTTLPTPLAIKLIMEFPLNLGLMIVRIPNCSNWNAFCANCTWRMMSVIPSEMNLVHRNSFMKQYSNYMNERMIEAVTTRQHLHMIGLNKWGLREVMYVLLPLLAIPRLINRLAHMKKRYSTRLRVEYGSRLWLDWMMVVYRRRPTTCSTWYTFN